MASGINVIRCRKTGEGLANKLGGGLCVCRSADECVMHPSTDSKVSAHTSGRAAILRETTT